MTSTHLPLAGWRFDGTLRTYQAEVLAQLPPRPADAALHIVAPPGSGKTLLGLLLAAREQRRTLVLAPSLTIPQQWVRTARTLAPNDDQVSDDPAHLSDLTVLTYQLLSVTGDSSPFDDLARAQWTDELTESGRTQADAETWLATIATDNRAQYLRGIRKRSASLRRRFAQARPDMLARVLHPNAIALIDRLVESGVDTIVLDECHHLLDHWAIVVAYLRARIRERGGTGLLIGLTATLPATADGPGFANYTGLLGEADYEVPTPAVVKEGHLAPYRAHVWFTEPVPREAHFIRRSEAQLHELMVQVLTSADGLAYLESQLQPADPDAGERPATDETRRQGIDRALSADFALARACGAVLLAAAPRHPLCTFLNPQLFGRASTDDLLLVLARFALTRLLPDPGARDQWKYVKGALADFGLHLTDRGIRRGRDPLEATLAASAAKDHATIDILRHELAAEQGERVRAVVVTDVVEAGDNRGLTGDAAPGALRVFELLAAEPVTAALSPVLLTAQHLRTTATDAGSVAEALRKTLGTDVEIEDGIGATRMLRVPGFGGGRLVAAVSQLVTDGAVRLLVGTRGLLGEGWDCPAVNTLIDLTAVATSVGTQQLRGRTLRLDPAWPEKVAHNWSVVCLIPPHVELDSPAELDRLRRRHSHLWGVSADDHARVITGLETTMDRPTRELLDRFVAKDRSVSIEDLNHAVLAGMRTRAQTRADWRVGEPYVSRERDVVAVRSAERTELVQVLPSVAAGAALPFALTTLASGGAMVLAESQFGWELPFIAGAGIAVGAGVLVAIGRRFGTLLRSVRHHRDPALAYRALAQTVAQALQDAGRIPPLEDASIDVDRQREVPGSLRLRLTFQGPTAVRRTLADAVQELFGPIRTPRFLLRIPTSPVAYLPVPTQIARRRADAEHFAELWKHAIGPCRLIELKGEDGLQLLRAARAQPGRLDTAGPRTTLWG
ncbi:DEAD/DEAH box helicase family protein [Microbacterium sp.]|uniref:DEAD/DEAH box helicase family protein n=1 Tax=Microbacterium sp. TaxID=51671 RepID=UPI003A902019